jgi:hypothetical protein
MKCPKCGYNSFEIHDTCKKCAHDLTGYKDTHGLKSIVLPPETRSIMAEKLMAGNAPDAAAAEAEVPEDMFSFAIPEKEATPDAGSFLKDDSFDFDDEPVSTPLDEGDFPFGKEQMSAQFQTEDETFVDFLESSSHNKSGLTSATTLSGSKNQVGLDLNDFNWDDMPDTAPGETAKTADDDFNRLFGDTDDIAEK